MASTVVAVGLSVAAAGFAGRYVLQAMKHMEPQVKQVFQSLPNSAFSGGYYRVHGIPGIHGIPRLLQRGRGQQEQ
uniref:Uncharacterized protein n=1 Tax=Castor canadensis TaxID=51338 RepID=A0A8C0XF06_CASCN